MNTYKIIDQNTWKRTAHCAVFRNCVEPSFCVTFDLDITAFYRKIKQKNLPFTFAMIYAVAKCANQIEEFRYRFLNGQVVLFDKIDTAFTYLDKQTELFKVVNVPFIGNIAEYCKTAKQAAEEQKEYFTGPLGNDVFQFSPMPWVTYTHISHTNSGKKDNELRFSIGVNSMNGTANYGCRFPCKRTTHLSTGCISANLLISYS